VVAVPLVAWLIAHYGWRAAFLVTGALGVLWLIAWLCVYASPERHGRITAAELQFALADRPTVSEQTLPRLPWHWVLACRQAWGVFLGRFFTDCIWWFYVYWLPKDLADQRGFSLKDIAASAWIPFVAADLGNLGGGWLSGRLIRRGWTVNAARKAVLVLGVLGMLAGVPAGLTSYAWLTIALIGVVTFSYSAWGTMMLTLPTDLFPSRQTASVSGFSGMGAGLGGMAFTWLIGAVVDRFGSYKPIFLLTGLMPIVALVLVQLLIPKISTTEARPALGSD
jgi:ACS family hexuronate transporter-like MFS transporter